MGGGPPRFYYLYIYKLPKPLPPPVVFFLPHTTVLILLTGFCLGLGGPWEGMAWAPPGCMGTCWGSGEVGAAGEWGLRGVWGEGGGRGG